MLLVRCDKRFKKMTEKFLKEMNLSAEITDEDICDVCVMEENDASFIHNIPADSIIIANGDNHDLVMTLGQYNNKVITCGLAGICTITLSSITDEEIVVCIQRNITDLCGKCIMPQEIPVKAKSLTPHDAMLMYALALVCGEKPDKLILEGR
ncbi:MAG: hypothetical protein IKL42_03990 [Clostridia bacterium]|nr:hypothetical protein [Clostridia bacterium]